MKLRNKNRRTSVTAQVAENDLVIIRPKILVDLNDKVQLIERLSSRDDTRKRYIMIVSRNRCNCLLGVDMIADRVTLDSRF